jgi:hypothetical protein
LPFAKGLVLKVKRKVKAISLLATPQHPATSTTKTKHEETSNVKKSLFSKSSKSWSGQIAV